MPRVAIKKKEYMTSDFVKWLVGEMRARNLKQKDMGAILGIKQNAFSKRLESGFFTYKDLITIFKKFETPEEEIVRLMKM